MRRLNISQARRIALAAQGFAEPRPRGRVDLRHLRRVVDRVGVVQLDSVTVVARAHYLTFFARLGSYPLALADRLGWDSGEMVEYWAHEAALVPVERWPLFRHRMERNWHWPSMDRWIAENPGTIEQVLAEVKARGPLRPADLDNHANAVRGPWWDWSDAKLALEALFFTGQLTIRDRVNFIRRYDLPERVLPPEIVARRVDHDESRRQLLRLAVQHHGVGTVQDLADYYRLKAQVSVPLLAGLAAAGEIEEVEVAGWKGPVYLDPAARMPRAIRGLALLCPFDPVVWFRPRAERLFNFHYRIEIYTPPAKRIYGYYVFPILLDGELVGRIDLKADRQAGILRVRGAYTEEGVEPTRVAPPLVTELETMATWLGLDDFSVEKKGNLATALLSPRPIV
ncbi:MAG TPA: crosslink repair DNA glycosylase YcaQ family protein [Acidimicrobiia bacterium]|nr:crosslink repair DNA glycosylase YcaQ family protein [Acidimicrobiia bacterium]